MFEGINIKEFISSLAIVGAGLITLLFFGSKVLSSTKPFKEIIEQKRAAKAVARKAIDSMKSVNAGIKEIKTEIKAIKSKVETVESNQVNQEFMEKGIYELLRFRLNRLLDHIIEQGTMSIDESLDLEGQFEAYKGLGGNGRVETKYKIVKERINIQNCEEEKLKIGN